MTTWVTNHLGLKRKGRVKDGPCPWGVLALWFFSAGHNDMIINVHLLRA